MVEVSVIPFKRKSASRVLGGVSSGDTEVGKNPFLSDKAGGHKKKVAPKHSRKIAAQSIGETGKDQTI